MFSPLNIIVYISVYMLVLFLIATFIEKKSHGCVVNNPFIYSLSMAIYCTAWTFYGSVGTAAKNGLLFSTVYIGPTLTIMFYWLMLKKMVILKNNHRITSIADFISTRYGKSEVIAALISIFLFIGIAPYIALQLKAVFSTINIITNVQVESVMSGSDAVNKGIAVTAVTNDTVKSLDTRPVQVQNDHKQPEERLNTLQNQIIIILLIVFTILFGVRKIDPTERHQGVVFVVAIVSVIKLIAFLSVGFFVTFHLYDGFQDVFLQFKQLSLSDKTLQLHRSDFNLWMTYFVLSMSAIIFLPRQFHISVVENFKTSHILTAIWLLPLYMFLINIFVYPIALGSLMHGIPSTMMDFSVLILPKMENVWWLTILVFIGGFSAAISMVIVCSMTLSTMMTNHILLPLIIRVKMLNHLKGYLLYFRWFMVSLCIVLGYYLSIIWSDSYILVTIGMVSFAAVFQLVPSAIGGMYWQRGNKMGALLGLCAGFLLWGYTLLLPALIKSHLVSDYILNNGLFGLEFLKPEQLFGLRDVAPLTNGVFWSILFNVLAYIGGSIYFEQEEIEKSMLDSFINIASSDASSIRSEDSGYTVVFSEKCSVMEALLSGYIGEQKANKIIEECINELKLGGKSQVTLLELVDMTKILEKRLTGLIGSASANYIIQHSSLFTDRQKQQLSSVYSNILMELRMSPAELRKRIDYHKEKEAILAVHTEELKLKNEENSRLIMELQAERLGLEHNVEIRTQEIKKNYELQNTISTILKLSYKNLDIKDFLNLALEILFSLHWFAAKSVGCIFLYDETAGVLKMTARKNFPIQLLKPCNEVQIGRCLCGLAASTKELVYKDCVDNEHEITFENIPQHGHYCVPIIIRDKVLGVLNVDVDAGHRKDKIEEQLLLMFADTLAAILERKKADEKLEYMANYDALTGVPNRILMFDRLAQSINQSKRYNDKTAVMYLDLDDFKPINDKYGHDAGDVVLKKTANRLKRCVRDTDTVSRLGGDEFAILARGFHILNDLTELCKRLVDEIGKPIEHKGHIFSVKASMGISVCPDDGSDAMLLLKMADTAMYSAKTTGGSFLFYKHTMDENLSERYKLEEDIRYAISTNQFVLYYQPQIDLKTDKVTGVEALIRWNHPTLGMIYPDKFIPIAEDTGLIIDIGKWVIKTACEQNIFWHKEGLPSLNIAVNIAANEFQQHDFVDNIIHILSQTQMDPTFLEIEITERISIQDIETTMDILYKLNKVGVKISLDDFGTGYSSLSYLNRLPFNKIKIDKSFVMEMQHNQDATVIVKTIVDMSHNLNKIVIAEGIETEEHLKLLKELDCDEGQGYLFSKPISAEDFVKFAKDKGGIMM